MAIVEAIGRAAKALWRALIKGPIRALRWIRANPSRAVAMVWLSGVSAFAAVDGRRAYREVRREQAVEAAEEAKKQHDEAPHSPEVVQMMDVAEIEQIEIDRMHANGLGAAGEGTELMDTATINAAREARAKVAVVEGERVGGSGDVVVVSKGGLAGWIARNKDKKADPETLAWLRGEEARDGRKAYAEWAEGGNTIGAWLERGKKLHGQTGSGSGSGSNVAPRATAPPPSPSEPISIEALGLAALASIAVANVTELRAPTPAEITELKARLPAKVDAVVRNDRLVLIIPENVLFLDDDLSVAGKVLARSLAELLKTIPKRNFQLIAHDGDHAMALAAALTVAGVDADRFSLSLAKDADQKTLDIGFIAR